MSYEKIQLNLNGNLYPVSKLNEVNDVEEFENIFFTDDVDDIESLESFSATQLNGYISQNTQYVKEELSEEEILIKQLEAEIANLESEYSANQEGKGIAGTVGGFFSSCWNGITGKGFKDNDRAELDAKIAMLEAVKSDPTKLAEAYKQIMGTELTEEAKQSAVEAQKLADSMSYEEKQQVVEMLQEQAASLSTLMQETKNDQGWFSKAMGGLNNVLGFGTNSNKANAKVEEYIKQVNSLDPNDPDFATKYQALTGEALSVDGLDELSQGVSKVGNSQAAEAIMDYEETQAAAKEIGSGIVTGVVVAACVIAAPFTGGASIALGAAVGGATTVLINGTDTIGTSKKYSLEQGLLDFGGGAINGAITAMTLGSAGIAGKGFSALKGAGSAAAKQGAKQMVSGGLKNTAKNAFTGFGKAAFNGAKIAAFAASSNYLLDTVGTNALYDLTGNLSKSETPANIVQNEDGTYSVYYELTDANTGEVISYEIETVDSLAQDEDGGLIKGNVVDVSRSNDFSFTEMAKQTAISAGTAALGAGIGKITGNIINPYATSMTNSVILGNTAEIASDMTLSLSADYLIASAQAGQFVDADEFFSWDRILGEGQNQIRGLLIGIASSKMNSLDAVSADAVRAGFDGQNGADSVEIPVNSAEDGFDSSATLPKGDSPFKPAGDIEDLVDPVVEASYAPTTAPKDNIVETHDVGLPTVKIDDMPLPKTQEDVIKVAGELALTGDEVKAKQLLEAFGMKPSEIDQFMAEVHSVKTTTQTDATDTKVVDEKIQAAIAKYRQKASHITTETLTVNGKSVQFEILHGSKDGGSNTGYYVVNKETGELFYAKVPNGGKQWLAEIAATKLYEAAGMDVPQIEIFTSPNGTKGVLSKFIPELQSLSSPHALANAGFGMDVLLENWDAIGLCYDNTLITADGTKVVKLDNGGSFDYKAQGQNKPFTAIPMELVTMLNPKTNPQAVDIYGTMSRTDMIASLEKAVSVDDAQMDAILKEYNCEEYSGTLKKRKQFMQGVITEMKNTPQLSGESTSAYMQRITNSCLDRAIDSATTKAELDEISMALKNVTDMSVKQKLQDKISAKLSGTTPVTPKSYTGKDIGVALEQAGFVKNYDGSYRLNLDPASASKLIQEFGSYTGDKVKDLYEMKIELADIDNIRTMLNQASKVIDVSGFDMTRVVLLYNSIKTGQTNLFASYNITKMTPAKWAMVLNIAKGKQISGDQLQALMNYKGSSSQINGGLSALKNGGSISPHTQKQIDDLQAFINTQVIAEDITLKRVEGYYFAGSTDNPYGCLFLVDYNGKPLSQVLDAAIKASQNGDPSAIQDVEYQINMGNQKLVATNERFTSACVLPEAINSAAGGGKVVWELTLKKGSKGAFLEGTNFGGGLSSECEILLQKDSQFEITGIKYDSTIGKWVVKANVTN